MNLCPRLFNAIADAQSNKIEVRKAISASEHGVGLIKFAEIHHNAHHEHNKCEKTVDVEDCRTLDQFDFVLTYKFSY